MTDHSSPAPGWGPPPPAPGPPTRRTVALVLGIVGLVGVAGLGLLGAVTFLGTTPEGSEDRVTPVSTVPPTTSGTEDGAGVPPWGSETTTTVPHDLTDSEATVTAAGRALADEWVANELEDPSADPPGACLVDGWLSEDTDGFRGTFGRLANGSTFLPALTVSVTTYTSAEAAQAELERARSPRYQEECEAKEVETEGMTTAAVVTLPPDPQAPGVAYELQVPGVVTKNTFTVVVGARRAHLSFCPCADLDLDEERAVARQVAAVMAEEQGLPVPG